MSFSSHSPAEHPVPTAEVSARRHPSRFFQRHALARRLVFVAGYEVLAVLFTVLVLSAMLNHGGGTSTVTAVLISTVAVIWNYVWNTLFEWGERRRGATARGPVSRAVHAVGFEGGVLIFTIPVVMLMLGVGVLEAFAIEAGLLVFFLVFTVVYTWVFDTVFGMPASTLSVNG